MPYGKLALDTIETSGSLAITGNVTTSGTLQPSAIRSTAANTAPVFQTSTGTPIGTLCRAWVNFDGTGTVAIRGAFNVSAITDFGVGSYAATFITPMPDVNYSAVATAAYRGAGSFEKAVCNNRLTDRCDVATADAGQVDVPYVGLAIFR